MFALGFQAKLKQIFNCAVCSGRFCLLINSYILFVADRHDSALVHLAISAFRSSQNVSFCLAARCPSKFLNSCQTLKPRRLIPIWLNNWVWLLHCSFCTEHRFSSWNHRRRASSPAPTVTTIFCKNKLLPEPSNGFKLGFDFRTTAWERGSIHHMVADDTRGLCAKLFWEQNEESGFCTRLECFYATINWVKCILVNKWSKIYNIGTWRHFRTMRCRFIESDTKKMVK